MLPRIRWEQQCFTRRQIPLSRKAWIVNREGISLGLSKKILLLRCPQQSPCSCKVFVLSQGLPGVVLSFATRLLLASSGQLSLRVTIAEPVSTREIQIVGFKNLSERWSHIHLYLYIYKSIHSNHRLLHSSGLPTRPQPPVLCLLLPQLQLGFVRISKFASESPRTTSTTHLLRPWGTPGEAPTSSSPSAPSHWERDTKERARNPHSKQNSLISNHCLWLPGGGVGLKG